MKYLRLIYEILIKPKYKLVPHKGNFHSDDVATTALAMLIFKKYKIERREPKDIDYNKKTNILIDQGSLYDENMNNFDHHQDSTLPASNVLFYNKYKNNIIKNLKLNKNSIDVFERILYHISDSDVGNYKKLNTLTIPTLINMANNINNSKFKNFLLAVDIMHAVFKIIAFEFKDKSYANTSMVTILKTIIEKLRIKEKEKYNLIIRENKKKYNSSKEDYQNALKKHYRNSGWVDCLGYNPIAFKKLALEEGYEFLIKYDKRNRGYGVTNLNTGKYKLEKDENTIMGPIGNYYIIFNNKSKAKNYVKELIDNQ